jgi:SAM-dependent methyltransferase
MWIMAHEAQKMFFENIKSDLPEYFTNVSVVDFGSKDYNGSLKDLFTKSDYIGVDISEGKNVDYISKCHQFISNKKFNTVISGEMLEHDEYWKESLANMYKLLRSGGLLVISCAGKNRPEHGTRRTDGHLYGTTQDYYMNLEPSHFREVLKESMFEDSECFDYNQDTYFYGIKN